MKNLLSKCLLCLGLMMMPIASWADEEYDTDRGFRHPGGLHTEADFVRIRQQLSEGNEKVVAAYNKLKSAAQLYDVYVTMYKTKFHDKQNFYNTKS